MTDLSIRPVTIPEGFIMKTLTLVIALALGSIASFAGLACGAPDSTTHVGKLMNIDKDSGAIHNHGYDVEYASQF